MSMPKILVAIDFSDAFEKVIKEAEVLARALSAGVTLLHVTAPEPGPLFSAYEPDLLMGGIEPDPQTMRDSLAKRYQQEHNRLQQISQELRDAGVDSHALLVQGTGANEILAEAEKLSVDMILLGTHGKGMAAKLLLGSTSEGVLRKSTMPVHMVPTREQ
jgi:nucleotide-binding universal stress UspA family protein